MRCPKCKTPTTENRYVCSNCGFVLRKKRSGLEYTHACEICNAFKTTKKIKVIQKSGKEVNGYMCDACRDIISKDLKVDVL